MSHKSRKTQKSKKAKTRTTVQSFWTGNPLSRLERAALQSFVNVGYSVVLYTYNPLAQFKQSVPVSRWIDVRDAREILPESALFQYAGRAGVGGRANAFSYLPFSDLFRFTMLHKRGGAWIDMDIFLLKPIQSKILARPYVFSSERTIQKGAYKMAEPEIVDMGYIQVPGTGDPLMSWILEHIPTGLLTLKTPFDYMNLFRRGISALGLERYILPAHAFLPLNWWDVKDSFGVGAGAPNACYRGLYGTEPFCVAHLKKPDVYGVHWFRAILRKKGLPYERAVNRVITDNLYERLIGQIEADAGLAKNSL
jgi:hypothetical protein